MAESIGDTLERLRITRRDKADSTSSKSESQRAAAARNEQQSVDCNVEASNNMQTSSVLSSDGEDVLLHRTVVGSALNDDELGPSSSRRPILICDAWYGFPLQKRPRKAMMIRWWKGATESSKWIAAGCETPKVLGWRNPDR